MVVSAFLICVFLCVISCILYYLVLLFCCSCCIGVGKNNWPHFVICVCVHIYMYTYNIDEFEKRKTHLLVTIVFTYPPHNRASLLTNQLKWWKVHRYLKSMMQRKRRQRKFIMRTLWRLICHCVDTSKRQHHPVVPCHRAHNPTSHVCDEFIWPGCGRCVGATGVSESWQPDNGLLKALFLQQGLQGEAFFLLLPFSNDKIIFDLTAIVDCVWMSPPPCRIFSLSERQRGNFVAR